MSDEMTETMQSDPDVVKTTHAGGRPPLVYAETTFKLETYEDARAMYQRVTLDYACGNITRDRARDLGYLLSGLLAFHKADFEAEMAAKIPEMEKAIEEMRKAR